MRNVTITLDESVADWARVWAAQHQTSVSRMLGELLAEKMAEQDSYARAMEDFLSAEPIKLIDEPSGNFSYPGRSVLHER
jgi:hypothetical protein